MKQIYTTTLRLNLADEDDRRAYEHLQRMDKKQYRSYSKAIVTAINDHFERQARLENDPYLETREKEDAFLRRVTEAIEQGLRFAPVGVPIFTHLLLLKRQPPKMTRTFRRHWTLLTASDTAFALVWYYRNTKRGHFCYYEDLQKKRDTKRTDI